MKTMMTATTSMVSRRHRRGIPPGGASGLAPRSMIIVIASLDLRLAFAQTSTLDVVCVCPKLGAGRADKKSAIP